MHYEDDEADCHMYLRDLSESLVRRWYLVLAGLVVVAGLGLLTYTQVPATYTARANVVLLPPESTVSPGGNPYLYLGGLNQALDVLTRKLDASSTRDPILAANPSGSFVVSPDTTTTGPILAVEASAPSPAGALSVLSAVLHAVPDALVALQEELGVAPSSQITSLTLTADESATTNGRSQLRVVIAVVAVGLVGTALLIGLIDGLLLTRDRERELERDEAAAAESSARRPGRVGEHKGAGTRVPQHPRNREPSQSRARERLRFRTRLKPTRRTNETDREVLDSPPMSVGPQAPEG
jgi:hypothetical protein